jgi:hypothetical protein
MKRTRTTLLAVVSIVILFSMLFSSFAWPKPALAANNQLPVTTIVVNSGTDPDVSDSRTCLSHSPCTLRRAIIQARGLSAAQKPVLISFDIPATAGEGYVSSLQVWKIQFSGISSAAMATLRYLNGGITIDGSTQPGGRAAGPKIILVGSGTGQNDGLKLGETGTQNENVIRGLGFQNFKTHIYVNSGGNIIEDNWFGLSDDGTDIVLRGGNPSNGSGNTGVSVAANVSNNIIRDNVFTGLAGVAAAINGNDTTFSGNYLGTIANGTVPGKETDPSLICLQWDWLGGGGISISGNRNLVENNVMAGIRIAVVSISTQADAIRMAGDYHIIRNNRIGRDVNNTNVGVCGRGIYLLGGTEHNQITTNQIVNPGLSAISLNDTPVVSTSDANTLRGNVIIKNTPWGEVEGNLNPEDAIQMTKSLPQPFLNFQPAKVTVINGKQVSGTSGTGSPCSNCVIELFLEDQDAINEALQSLAVVTANASGNWTATLPAALTASQGLRTTSTTAQNNTISGMSTGTTTGLSVLYVPSYKGYLPIVTRK